MPLQALQLLEKKIEKRFERQLRLFEHKKDVLERKIEGHIRLFELKRGALEQKIEHKIETHKKKLGLKFETQKKKFETHLTTEVRLGGIELAPPIGASSVLHHIIKIVDRVVVIAERTLF